MQERLPTLFIIPMIHIIMGIILFIALLNGQRDLIMLILLIMSVIAGAFIWGRWGLSQVVCELTADNTHVFPGEPLTLTFTVENTKSLPIWVRISLSIKEALPHAEGKSTLTAEGGLSLFQKARFKESITPLKRGWHRLGPPRLTTGDLLGFYTRQKDLSSFIYITVYPKPAPITPFFIPKRDFFGVPGKSNLVPDPIYVSGVRDYQHFHPARYIHWKASARRCRLQEKICEPSERENLLIAIDAAGFAKNNAADAFECMLEIATSLSIHFADQKWPMGLFTNCILMGGGFQMLPVTAAPNQLFEILNVFARMQMESKGAIMEMMHTGLDLCPGVSCIYFTYTPDDAVMEAEDFFEQRGVPMTCVAGKVDSTAGGQNTDVMRSHIYSMEDILNP
ncbi:DUF58 domain-containing protein [Thermodesulfobacteriota bacterium]